MYLLLFPGSQYIGDTVNLKKGLTLLMLAMLSVSSFSAFAFSDQSTETTDDCELASDLLALVNTSREKAEAIIQGMEDEGTEIPEEAIRALEKGDEFLEEALELMDDGDCKQASAKLTVALQHYGKAAQKALEAGEEHEEEEHEEEAEKAIGLREAIERAYSFLEKVNETAADFEEKGINVTEVRNLLLEANQTLTQAENELDDGNFTVADELKSSAREMIGQAMGLLQSMNKGNKAEKAEEFLEKTKERLQELLDKLNEILGNLDLPPEAVEGINEAFTNAQDKLQVIKDLIRTGDLEDALDELDEVLEESGEALEAVDEHDHGIGNKLGSIEKIQAKLEILNETVQRLKSEGENVTALEDLLTAAKGKLEEASEILATPDLGEEQIDAVEELIEEAEELVEEADDLLDDLKKDLDERREEEREEREEEADELREDINKLPNEIGDLNMTAQTLASEGVNVTAITSLLEDAKTTLEGIDPEGEKDAAETQMDEAKDLIEEAEKLIEELLDTEETEDEEEDGTEETTAEEISERIEKLEEELSSLEEEKEELAEEQVNVEQLAAQIDRLRDLIAEAKASENPEEIVERAESLLEEIEDLLDSLG